MAQTLLPPTKVSKRAVRTVKMASATAHRSKNLSITTGGKISAQSVENLSIISAKLINVDNFLKDSLVLDKVKAGIARKKAKQDLRDRKEDESEKDASGKLKLPGQKFFGKVNNWITKLLFGWLAIKLLEWLPTIKEWLPKIAKAVDWIFEWGGKILDGLVTFIDKGYEAYDNTRGWVKDKFGDEGVQKFDAISGHLNKAFNIIGAIALAAAAFGIGGGGGDKPPRGPRRGPRNQLRRARTRLRRFTNPNRAALDRLNRIKDAQRQRRIAENVAKRQRFWRRVRPTNVRRTAQTALERTGRFFQGGPKPKPQGGGWMSRFGKSINTGWKATRGTVIRLGKGALNISKSGLRQLNGFRKGMMSVAGDAIQGVMARGKEWAKSVGDIAEMMKNPGKLVTKVKQVLKGPMEGLLKENKFGKQLMKLKELAKDPKKAKDAISSLFKNAKKSKGLLKLREGLKSAKKATKGIGGIDKVIAAIMGLLDYTVFGEAPINAILKAVGALVGYSAGFAIGAPFGGAPGFVTGMAGGWVGEKAASALAGLLAKTPLKDIDDPIAGAIDAMPDRKLVRDPAGGDLELTEEQQSHLDKELGDGKDSSLGEKDDKPVGGESFNKGSSNLVVSKDNSKLTEKVQSVSSSASYEDGESKVVFVPLPGEIIPVSGGDGETIVGSSSNGNGSVDDGELYIR